MIVDIADARAARDQRRIVTAALAFALLVALCVFAKNDQVGTP